MADRSVSVSEYSLTCSICLEQYTKPRCLPCLHSFCNHCLYGYIDKVIRNTSSPSKGFNCPCCRVFIAQPPGNPDLNTWMSKFPINFTLVSILDSVTENMASIDVLTVYCGNCSRGETESEAEVRCVDCDENLCCNCREIHVENDSLSSHSFCDLKHMSGYQPEVDTSRKISTGDHKTLEKLKALTMCPKHPEVEVKMVCIEHNDYCCSDCAIVHHRKCDQLISVQEKVESTAKALKGEVDNMNNDVTNGCDILLELEQRRDKMLKESSKRVKSDVEGITQLMHDYVEALERRLTEQIRYKEKETSLMIMERTDELNTLKDRVAESKEFMDTANAHGDKLQCHFSMLKMKECLEHVEGKVCRAFKGIRMEELDLPGLPVMSAEMYKLTNNVDVLMRDGCKELPTYPGLKPLYERTPVLKSEMCFDNKGNIDGCEWISDVVILIAERDKKRISLIDIHNQVPTATASFPTAAWQTTKIDKSTVAVSFPDEKKVRLIKVRPASLEKIGEINVEGKCYGLVYDNTDRVLMVLLRDKGQIMQYRLGGNKEVRSIPVNGTTKSDIKGSYCMAYNKDLGHIYISCHETQKVVAINMEGEQVFVYTSPNGKGPWGMVCDSDHYVYVCWFGSSTVEQIDKSGRFVREILGAKDKLVLPLILTLNDDMDSFILTASQEGKQIKHYRYM